MRKVFVLAASIMVVLSLAGIGNAQKFQGKRILFVDSYHEGYGWSDGITNGVKGALDGTGVELKIIRLDTKRNRSEEFKKEAALKAKAVIEEFKPHVVLAADDNASKYLIVPYFKDSSIPFVFCAVNWDASIYGFPYKNITGMVEVAPVPQLLEQLKGFAKGDRIGYIAADNLTSRKEGEYYKKLFNLKLIEHYATNFEEWKKGFKEIQGKVDMLIVGNNAGIPDWDTDGATAFAEAETMVPTGVIYDFMAQYALIGFTKLAEEQGGWAAAAALKILGGTSPSDIPVEKNKEGKLIVNIRIAQKLGAEIPFEFMQSADQVIE